MIPKTFIATITICLCSFFAFSQNTVTDNSGIFDRYGIMIFHSVDKDFKWYGDFFGKTYINVTYNYIIYITDYNGISNIHKGKITVL